MLDTPSLFTTRHDSMCSLKTSSDGIKMPRLPRDQAHLDVFPSSKDCLQLALRELNTRCDQYLRNTTVASAIAVPYCICPDAVVRHPEAHLIVLRESSKLMACIHLTSILEVSSGRLPSGVIGTSCIAWLQA